MNIVFLDQIEDRYLDLCLKESRLKLYSAFGSTDTFITAGILQLREA